MQVALLLSLIVGTNVRLEQQASTCVSYDKLTKIFKETTDKHAPQKKQKI